MTLPPDPLNSIALNTQTVNQLLEQTEMLGKQPNASEGQQKALLNLKGALEAVLPYLEQTPPRETDEVALEKDIRQEIVIAGSNENG